MPHERRPAGARWRRLAAWVGVVVLLAACGVSPQRTDTASQVAGDPELGRAAISEYGCLSCHDIPGVRGPGGTVGPPLQDWATRRIIAGHLPNTPENLRAWIEDPQAIDPGNAMPDVGVSPEDAAHIAAYLFTLR